jgi:hypothetical protein
MVLVPAESALAVLAEEAVTPAVVFLLHRVVFLAKARLSRRGM